MLRRTDEAKTTHKKVEADSRIGGETQNQKNIAKGICANKREEPQTSEENAAYGRQREKDARCDK
jgi:hypothetical protein